MPSSLAPRWLFLLLTAALLVGCAETQAPPQPTPPDSTSPVHAAPPLTSSEAQGLYKVGVSLYGESQYDLALSDLDAAVASGNLKTADAIIARKYMAFIHCMNKREAQCREQFQAILKLDPNFTLAPNEADHPLWGPVWVSVKAAGEDQKAVARGTGFLASKGQQKLAEGIQEYDAGHFNEAIAALQAALESGLSDKNDQIRARKYMAFSYCLTTRKTPCRAEFHAIFTMDPAFTLVPSEVGHPAWAAIYRSELAAAKKAQAVKGK